MGHGSNGMDPAEAMTEGQQIPSHAPCALEQASGQQVTGAPAAAEAPLRMHAAQRKDHAPKAAPISQDGAAGDLIPAHRAAAPAGQLPLWQITISATEMVEPAGQRDGISRSSPQHAQVGSLGSTAAGAMQQDDLLDQAVTEWQALCDTVAGRSTGVKH